jgi:hypothetical protein
MAHDFTGFFTRMWATEYAVQVQQHPLPVLPPLLAAAPAGDGVGARRHVQQVRDEAVLPGPLAARRHGAGDGDVVHLGPLARQGLARGDRACLLRLQRQPRLQRCLPPAVEGVELEGSQLVEAVGGQDHLPAHLFHLHDAAPHRHVHAAEATAAAAAQLPLRTANAAFNRTSRKPWVCGWFGIMSC